MGNSGTQRTRLNMTVLFHLFATQAKRKCPGRHRLEKRL
eukprot:SAG22_NODE_530_length_9427_cov_3.306818_3_plen_39_part_00